MKGRGITWLLFFSLMLLIVMGCGRKAPPTLPEEPSSLTSATKARSPEGKIDINREKFVTPITVYYE
jgi:predicted small lipoprotein YifL